MRWSFWNNLSFRLKLIIYGGLVTLLALLVTGVALVRLEASSFRKQILQTTITVADVASQTCASSLIFDDPDFARRVLEGLDVEQSIDRACIFDIDGRVFASFERAGRSDQYPAPGDLPPHRFVDDSLELMRLITWSGVPVGSIYVQARLDELGERIQIFAVAMVILLVASFAVSLLFAAVLQRGLRRPIVELQETADRVSRERDYSARARQFGRDELGHLTESFNEMLARIERRERDLHESEARYAYLLGRIDEVVFRLTIPEGRLEFCSPGARSLFGHDSEAMVADPELLLSLVHPEERDHFDQMLRDAAAGQVVPIIEFRIIDGQGCERTISQSNYPVCDAEGHLVSLEGLFIDVSDRVQADREREQLRTELVQAHKLEALGTLTGGIAHDFNNILGAIMGNASLALEDLPAHHPLHDTIRTILQASERAAQLTRQILAFSRQRRQEQLPVDLAEILRETLALLRASLPATISIKTHIPDGVSPVLADPTQLHQVVMNLCANAQHAMRESGGLLEIELHRRDLTADEAKRLPDLSPGPHLELAVTDTGEGIAAEAIERIFEPFFTTKPEGEGTGMGLAVVYGIVRDHGGHIAVESELGHGTTFRILLPVIAAAVQAFAEEHQGSLEGSGRVLVVDDEEMIVNLVERMLERLGYEVTGFTNPWLALEEFEKDPGAFDLILTDYTMPNLTGLDIARRVRRRRPKLPIVISTGNRDRIDRVETDALGSIRVAAKPFNLKQLGQLVRECLTEK